jgi:hypothetical protein
MLDSLHKATWVAAFAFVVTFWVAMVLRSSPPVPPHEPAKSQNLGRPKQTSVTQNSQHQTGKNQSGESQWYDHITDWLVATFSGLLVLATVALFISAEKSADAARQSADIARQALVGTQRAFVFLKQFEVVPINQEIRILPQWENSGSTPTTNARSYVNWKTFVGDPPPNYSWPDLDANGNPLTTPASPQLFFVAPKGTKYAHTLIIPNHTMDAVRDKTERLFVWGWINYEDEFGQDHRTEFCNEVIVTSISVQQGQVTVAASFADYGPHNTAR